MAFSNWDTYRQLLEKLTEQRANWSNSKTYVDFDDAMISGLRMQMTPKD